jgi:hypothetical protein
MGREDEIRVIACNIWEQEGCRDGHDCDNWLKAEVIWEEKEKDNAASANSIAVSKRTAAAKLFVPSFGERRKSAFPARYPALLRGD